MSLELCDNCEFASLVGCDIRERLLKLLIRAILGETVRVVV